jgi:hypothetical protein
MRRSSHEPSPVPQRERSQGSLGVCTITGYINVQNFGAKLDSLLLRNWGLTDHELQTIPPALVRGFMKNGRGGFGSLLPGDFGRLLMRDALNSELYGPLQEEYLKGARAGTDFWIHKNRLFIPPLHVYHSSDLDRRTE